MVCQSTSMQLIDHREQASSYNVRGCTQISRPTQFNCGSGLAREGAVSANINAGCTDVFASKPAPTGFVCAVMTESDHPRRMLLARVAEHGAVGRWLAAFGFADAVAGGDFGGDQGLPG